MLVIPAIDLKDGKCVRLWQGKKHAETIYSDDPLRVGRAWAQQGAKRLHVVDLDGAFKGAPQHLELARAIRRTAGIPVQYGGGIRTGRTLAQVLQAVDLAIIGTRALAGNFLHLALAQFPGRIIASADFKGDRVAVRGWEVTGKQGLEGVASRLTGVGAKTIIMTDVERDGTLGGVDTVLVTRFAGLIPGCQLMVAGGISSVADIKRLAELQLTNLVGVIAGRALYTGDLELSEAIAAVQGEAK